MTDEEHHAHYLAQIAIHAQTLRLSHQTRTLEYEDAERGALANGHLEGLTAAASVLKLAELKKTLSFIAWLRDWCEAEINVKGKYLN